ncbi:MAG: CAP domain-containing protein [Sediminibacterium sp.]|nr:CAP domain-containing protein [Sediminibacterium sp.]
MPGMRFFYPLFFLVLLAPGISGKAQTVSSVTLIDQPFVFPGEKNKHLIQTLETYPAYKKASHQEKELIYWTNYARLYPVPFRDSALIPFIKSQPSLQNNNYTKSLIQTLDQNQALPFLAPNLQFAGVAANHANDIYQNKGRISHHSSNGTSFANRMRNAGITQCASENISSGKEDALVALMLLYLDIGVPDLGHRKNLLNPAYTEIGVGVVRLEDGRYLMVQNLGCSK